MCLDVLDRAEKRWNASGAAGLCLAALLLYNDKVVSAPKSFAKQPSNETIESIVRSAFKKHREFVQRDNHGVKEANLLKMLLPIGFKEADFDSLWLSVMNTFGVSRGLVAHQSANRVQTPPDPALARQQVNAVLGGLQNLEGAFKKLRQR